MRPPYRQSGIEKSSEWVTSHQFAINHSKLESGLGDTMHVLELLLSALAARVEIVLMVTGVQRPKRRKPGQFFSTIAILITVIRKHL
jgi:hypothetical protein